MIHVSIQNKLADLIRILKLHRVERAYLFGSVCTENFSAESDIASDISRFLEKLGSTSFLVGVSPTNQETKVNSLGTGITTTTFNVKANFAAGATTP